VLAYPDKYASYAVLRQLADTGFFRQLADSFTAAVTGNQFATC